MLSSSRWLASLALVLTLGSLPAFAEDEHIRPDPSLTPGQSFPGVTAAQICEPGYSSSVRHVTAAVRRQAFANYGLSGNHTGYCSAEQGCELDHLVSLELGGSNDVSNLWPEPYDGPWNAHIKDKLENRLHKLVCDGSISLPEAQRLEATDWIAAYKRFVGGDPLAMR
jgi:hypothetical protein